MSILSFERTKSFVDMVLGLPPELARIELHYGLRDLGSNEMQFYKGVCEHAESLGLSSAQWFDLLSRLPSRGLRAELDCYLSLIQQTRFRDVGA